MWMRKTESPNNNNNTVHGNLERWLRVSCSPGDFVWVRFDLFTPSEGVALLAGVGSEKEEE